jgi:hypothetical protein
VLLIKNKKNTKTMNQLLTAVAALLLFTACKKENTATETPAPTASSKKLTKWLSTYGDGSTETDTYGYDNAGRLNSTTSDNYTETFDYVSATKLMVTAKKKSTGELYQTKECTLDVQGRITNIIFKSNTGVEIYRYDYTYNADGYMIKEKGGSPSNPNNSMSEYTYLNGNIVSASVYSNGVINRTTQYIIDDSKENNGNINYFGYWPSVTLFGKPTKNLSKEVVVKNLAGAITWRSQSTYELNAEKYPVKMVRSFTVSGTVENATLTFE